jgi:hypothetical protein
MNKTHVEFNRGWISYCTPNKGRQLSGQLSAVIYVEKPLSVQSYLDLGNTVEKVHKFI